MFYFVPGGIKSAYRTSSCLRLKGSSMPFRRRRPSTFKSNGEFLPVSITTASSQYLVMTGEPFLKGTVVGFKCSQELTTSTLSSFIVIFQPNTSFLGFQSPFFTFSPFSPKVEFSCLFFPPHQLPKVVFLFVFPPQKKPIKLGLVRPFHDLNPNPLFPRQTSVQGLAGIGELQSKVAQAEAKNASQEMGF